jgi:two-component system sensor histidine kinase AlgZ
MDSNQNMDVRHMSRGVYPPSFCDWRLALGIMALTQVSVLLIGLGGFRFVSWQWLSVISTYSQSLALICTAAVCINQKWLRRLSIRDAWVGCWVISVLTTIAVSYACAVIGTVLGIGPGKDNLPEFMLKSTLAVSLVCMALLRHLFIRAQWQAELIAQADARVQALQARIRPHFLFNSLNTIASLIADEPDNAERATEDLAELFRGSMRRADSMIPLAEELSLGRRFLDMEQRRLGDRLQIEWRVEELPENAMVLPLILQPLLENAVLHGIQSREDGGLVKVYGRGEPENIVIMISNPAAVINTDSRTAQDGHGMALNNIRRRLELAFGDRASLVTSQNEEQFYSVLTLPSESTR